MKIKIFYKFFFCTVFLFRICGIYAQKTLAVMNDSIENQAKPLNGIQTMRAVFSNMPDSIIPVLTKNNRLDCIDFFDSHMKAVVKNRFSQESEMETLTKDYLSFKTSTSGSFEMKLLPVNDSTQIFCLVKHFYGPACDSEISFYNFSWQKLPSSHYISLPDMNDFLVSDSTRTSDMSAIDMKLYQINLDSLSSDLKISFSSLNYLSKENAVLLTPSFGKNFILYQWMKGRFIRKE